MRAQQVKIGSEQISITGTTARVVCEVYQSFTPRAGSGDERTVTSEFRLQKVGGRWIIISRR